MPKLASKSHIIPEVAAIGRRIAEYREANALTQAQLAKRLKTSQSAIARMEKGEQNLSAKMLIRLGDILHEDLLVSDPPALNFRIEGGRKLAGTVVTNNSKNSAVVMLCAALLNRNTTVLKRMPRIEEVHRVIEVLQSIGVEIRWQHNNVIITPPAKIDMSKIDVEAAIKTRSIVFLLAVLPHWLKEFSLPHPGGCRLGARTVRPHLYALQNYGLSIVSKTKDYHVTAGNLQPAEYVLYESGDTVTENALMAAACIDGVSTIKFASANYMVQDLCYFLKKLGVKIEGIGTSTLRVHGIKRIDKRVTYEISPDPIESMFFLAVAATTGSAITIQKCPIDFLQLELLKLGKMGLQYEVGEVYRAANGFTKLVDVTTHPSKLRALEEKIHPNIYPGLNMDNLPFFVPIATQAKGQTMIHDWPYENRAIYYMEMTKLGADMTLADPHRVYVSGPTKLRGTEMICPPALRPAAAILIGMLAASGTSILRNVYSINRGYEDLYSRLNTLGAKIEVLREF